MHITYGTIVTHANQEFQLHGNKSESGNTPNKLATLDKAIATIGNTPIKPRIEATFPRIRCIAGRDLSEIMDKYNFNKTIALTIPATVKCRQFTLDPVNQKVKRAKVFTQKAAKSHDSKRKRKKPETLSSKLNALKEKSKLAARSVHTHILGASLTSALEELETREKAAADTLREMMQANRNEVYPDESDSWKRSTDPILSSVVKTENAKSDFDEFENCGCDVMQDEAIGETEKFIIKKKSRKAFVELSPNIEDWSVNEVTDWICNFALKISDEKTSEIVKSKVGGVDGKDFRSLTSKQLKDLLHDDKLVEVVIEERDKMMQVYEQNMRMKQPFVCDSFANQNSHEIELPNLSDVSDLLDNPSQLSDVALSVPSIQIFSKSHVKQERPEDTFFNSYTPCRLPETSFSINNIKTEMSPHINNHTSQFTDHTSHFNEQQSHISDQYFSNYLQWNATPKENLHYKSDEWSKNANNLSPTSDSDSGIHSPTNSMVNFTSGYATSSAPFLVTSQVPLPPCGVFSHTPLGMYNSTCVKAEPTEYQKPSSANWEIIALNQHTNTSGTPIVIDSNASPDNSNHPSECNSYYYVNNGTAGGQLYQSDCSSSIDDVTEAHQSTMTSPVVDNEADDQLNKCSQKPVEEEFTFRFKTTTGMSGKSCHLWEFIRDTLLDDEYCPKLIKWEDRTTGVFRFVQSDAVAKMWGDRKNNPKMTYEKLSRAMRYYYNRGILERVDGRRLVYKFGKNSHGWKESEVRNKYQEKQLVNHTQTQKKEFFNFPYSVANRKRTAQENEACNADLKKLKSISSENNSIQNE